MNIPNRRVSPTRPNRHDRPRPVIDWLAIASLATLVSLPALGAQVPPGILTDPISPNPALELRLGYQSGNDKILYSGLYDAGADNALEFRMLSATPTSVTVDQDHGDIDTGPIFALGDWCFTSSYAVMPYIKDFNIHALRYNLTTSNFGTIQLTDSLAAQYTTTDCFALDGGSTLVIGANNFDVKGLDYFASVNDGQTWSLTVTYRLPSGQIIGPFANAIRDSHDTFDGTHIGSVYQRGDGVVESVALQLDGSVVGRREIADGASFLGNGRLKETDSYGWYDYCFGIANLGDTLSSAFIDTMSGNVYFGPFLDNQSGTTPIFGFEGVDLSGRELTATTAEVFLTSQFLYFVLFDASTHAFTNPRIATDYPLAGNGGPVDGFWSEDKGRLFLAGITANFRGTSSAGTVAVIVDPATARTQPAGGELGPVVVSVLGQRAWVLLASILIALAGAALLYRRTGT